MIGSCQQIIRNREVTILDRKRVNEAIAGAELMLIDERGTNLGAMSREQAFFLANTAGFDIVEVSGTTTPPVVRFMDYNKERYEQEKRARRSRVKQRSGDMKEIKLSFKISEHDFQTRIRHAQRFLERGDQVKLTMRLIGRENAFFDAAKQKFERFATDLGMQTSGVARQGNRLNTVLRKDAPSPTP